MCKENLYLFALIIIGLTGCDSGVDPGVLDPGIDKTVHEILSEALDAAGGVKTYQSLSKLKFRKIINLYDSSGTLEEHSEQQHRYHFKPERVLEMIWQDEKGQHQLVLVDDQIKKFRNGQPDTDFDPERSRQNLVAAEYSACLPFKLLDRDIQFQYEGIDTLNDHRTVHVIRAQYPYSDRSDFNTQDIWWHYFNTKSFIHEGYKVKHADHYSLVINEQFKKIDELLLPTARTSYRVDETGRQLFIRADYAYQDYRLRKASKKLE